MEKRATEDEMIGWHHRFNGHEFEQTPGDSEEQGSLACCRPWSCKELDTAELLNNTSKLLRLDVYILKSLVWRESRSLKYNYVLCPHTFNFSNC